MKTPEEKRAYQREWRAKNIVKVKAGMQRWWKANRDVQLAYMARRRENEPALYMWRNARRRAAAKGLPFSIAVEDIVCPKHCPILGLVLNYRGGKGKVRPDSPSLDRLVPRKGYVRGNVCVISHRANSIKNDATAEELLAVAEYLERFSA